MKKISYGFIALMALISIAQFAIGASNESPNIQAARSLFEQYISLGKAFDPAAADLYADEARIQNSRTYPDGTKRTLTMPAAQYKDLIRKTMSLAKARGDTNEYSEITYSAEGSNVRIMSIRHSNLKNYDSPLSLLVGKAKDGAWKILEEISESKP